MTLEELKVEANKLGYKLIKKKPYTPIKPCPVCGKKCTHIWYSAIRGMGTKKQCYFCDFAGDWTNEKIPVEEAWNNAVERYLKEHEEVK